MGMRFIWDAAKAEENRRKHGVSFGEALAVFSDPQARIHDDLVHSAYEPREIIVGRSARGRVLLVCFTEREEAIRLISARKATRHEREDFDEATGF